MNWQLDKAHSSISFSVKHMMISKVRGQFEEFTGTFDLREDDPSKSQLEVLIAAKSINTREPQRDQHLRSSDFFDVEKYPQLIFKSKKAILLSPTTGELVGDLTIKDQTKEVTLAVTFEGKAQSPWQTTSYGFSATTTINRKDWGLVWNQALETGGVLVGEEIKIDIEVEFIKQA